MADAKELQAFFRNLDQRGWSNDVLLAVAEAAIYPQGGGPSGQSQWPERATWRLQQLGVLNTKNVRRAMVHLRDLLPVLASEGAQTPEEYVLGYKSVGEEVSEPERKSLAQWNGFSQRALQIAVLDPEAVGDWNGVRPVIARLVEDVAHFWTEREEMKVILKEGSSYHPRELDYEPVQETETPSI